MEVFWDWNPPFGQKGENLYPELPFINDLIRLYYFYYFLFYYNSNVTVWLLKDGTMLMLPIDLRFNQLSVKFSNWQNKYTFS